HLVLLDDLPESVEVGIVGRAFVHHHRRTVRERAVYDVTVSVPPADVGRAPVDVLVLEIEDDLRCVGDLSQVSAGRMKNTLRLSGRARCVEDVERNLGTECPGRAGART